MLNSIKTDNRMKRIAFIAVWELIILAITIQMSGYYEEYHSYQKAILLIGILLMAASLAAYIALFVRKTSFEITYTGIAIILGLVFNLMIPAYCVPDEQIHYWKAYQLSNTIMHVESDVKTITMRADDAELPVKTKYGKASALNKYYCHMNDPLKDDAHVTTAYYSTDVPEYLYIVPAAGLSLGRLLRLNSVLAFMLGRLFNNIFFIMCTALAINRIPRGKIILLFTALLPITLQQAASYSYDAPIIASSFILIAYTMRLISGIDLKRMDWIVYAMGSMVLLPTKSYAYVLLAFIPLAAINTKPENRKTNRLIIAVVLAAVLFAVAVYCWDKVLFYTDRVAGVTQNYPEYYSLNYLIHNPLQIWIIIETTFRIAFGFYISSMIGENLGWLNIIAPSILTYTEIVLIMLASIKRKNEALIPGYRHKRMFIAITVLTFCFICAGMLLSWTSIKTNSVEGVQGRYFLPVLPLLLLCLQTKELEIDSKWDNNIVYCNLIWLTIFVFCILNRFQV